MQAYERLEVAWAEWNELDPACVVACSSGTAALHLALEASGKLQNEKVLVCDFNMVAVPRAVVLAGHRPLFIDCNDQLLMDTDYLRSHRWIGFVGATIVTHTYGRRADVSGMNQSGVLVEDLAEAHGIRPTGDAACWSFYKNKVVAGEEGGAVWFSDRGRAKRARSLRSLGFTDAHDFTHIPRGHNYRMSNAHAALVLKSLADVDANLEGRRVIESWYEECCPVEWRMPPRDVPWVYDVRLPIGGYVQDRVVTALRERGIQARHAFKPMTYLEEWQDDHCGLHLPTKGTHKALTASQQVLYLPIEPFRTFRTDCERAFGIITDVLARFRA